tara:strand:- start:1998 stop:3131 length:1134 start_codon:yes stop_codon:yes gene_type:complete
MNVIRLSKSCISNKEKEAVIKVMDNEFLGMGKEVASFEKDLTNFLGRNVVCVTNGTAALQLSLQAAGVGIGDEVLVQSLTYLATFQAITATGAIPIPCDIDLNTFTIDINDAKEKLSERTAAVVPVHYAGGVGNLENIYQFADLNNIRVIEDAAHAFGTKYKKKFVGSFGDITCFSFDGIKNITSGEGGCICSDDEILINKVKDLRLLGVIKDSENRYSNKRTWVPKVQDQGWRYHMSDIMAAIGKVQLERFEELSSKRKEIALRYDDYFSNQKDIYILKHNYQDVNPHIYPIILGSNISRDLVREEMNSLGIQTGIHYYPNHLLDYFNKGEEIKLKNTQEIYQKILTMPLHPDLSSSDTEYVCNSLISTIKKLNGE